MAPTIIFLTQIEKKGDCQLDRSRNQRGILPDTQPNTVKGVAEHTAKTLARDTAQNSQTEPQRRNSTQVELYWETGRQNQTKPENS